jgi:membrane-bound serine protease (ClpP class)
MGSLVANRSRVGFRRDRRSRTGQERDEGVIQSFRFVNLIVAKCPVSGAKCHVPGTRLRTLHPLRPGTPAVHTPLEGAVRALAAFSGFGYGLHMKIGMIWIALVGLLAQGAPGPGAGEAPAGSELQPTVYVLPVRGDIAAPMVYVVRRGVKEAMAANAEALIIDMETNGGRFDSTKEIIDILDQFTGLTVTYVNRDAYSAGAFIAVATRKIFMAPQSVIGAATPIMMSPGGGLEGMPANMEAKMTSAVAARVRASAEKNGHNTAVVEAMIDRSNELVMDGIVLNREGQILTLTNYEAERQYGDPPRPLLSLGTVAGIPELLERIGFEGAVTVEIVPTGAERIAAWINLISPILLMIGIVGIYLEIKTPGFGVPGLVGILAFALYFLGGYVAGLSGMEWVILFVVGLILLILELFVFPGTLVLGLAGAVTMLIALVMAMVDVYPGGPLLPSFGDVREPLSQMGMAMIGAAGAIAILTLLLPRTQLYDRMVSEAASGVTSVADQARRHAASLGLEGVTISPLRPGGKARFGDQVVDVISQGDRVETGRKVRIVGHSASEAVVQVIDS